MRKPVFWVSDQAQHNTTNIYVAKTKTLISWVITYAKSRFSHNAAHIAATIWTNEPCC